MTGPRLGSVEVSEDTPGPQAYYTERQLTEREKVRRSCRLRDKSNWYYMHVDLSDTPLCLSFSHPRRRMRG